MKAFHFIQQLADYRKMYRWFVNDVSKRHPIVEFRFRQLTPVTLKRSGESTFDFGYAFFSHTPQFNRV
jgi:hypothetical protein